ncbi:hypothetical protein [Gottfriedia solisilvae]|uniref:HEAT repeat domain-containing protein n=1 Tax=Gottfriedia solisilvae TaxID=1516104 RepID=A0A8J3AEW1_9BACI|nr:hypothetical protein [Gottfriedia solisilvae]GGI11544.1 hypothetical protein GCM10007380_08370 [Gottfriedia solisilvae]
MYNFENEIKQINNKQLDDFFGNDYFHDGFILFLDLTEDNILKMKFACEREKSNVQDKAEHWYLNEDYQYNVFFKDCTYLNMEIIDYPVEYINGRFKNSVKLKQMNKESGKSNYHLRMQVAGGGFIDIIFRDFLIQKLTGSLPKFEYSTLSHFEHISKRFEHSLDISEIQKLSVDEDNISRDWAIVHLFILKDTFTYEAAVKALDSTEDDVVIASVFVLGEIAGTELISNLFTLWSNNDFPIMKRHILDSIEKIIERSK